MTLKTLRDQLLSNPHFVVSYIVGNNPGAVEDRLRAMGFTISTEDDIF
jgi:Fe2+ transport system protein FeoA